MEIVIYKINKGAKNFLKSFKVLGFSYPGRHHKMSVMVDELITKHSLCEFKYIMDSIKNGHLLHCHVYFIFNTLMLAMLEKCHMGECCKYKVSVFSQQHHCSVRRKK